MFVSAVREIQQYFSFPAWCYRATVAPLAGAWIETSAWTVPLLII